VTFKQTPDRKQGRAERRHPRQDALNSLHGASIASTRRSQPSIPKTPRQTDDASDRGAVQF